MAKGKYHKWIEGDGLIKLEAWARDGLTDEQIASNIGVNRGTLYTWMNQHPIIRNALKKGKEVVDIQVENALLRRALGTTVEEVVTEVDSNGKKHKKVTKKEIPPDTTAQIYWLKNRRRDKWKDKWDVEVSGELRTVIVDDLAAQDKKDK